ncbi:MAG: GNAT family N-acetyltransferase, partial [Clostridiales bacterium]|nr:GNAT family N-acetyltransferase [Clostridiales bacterium]
AYIENEVQLHDVLEFCYAILGQNSREIEYYTYEAWKERLGKYSPVLVYAHENGEIIAAVLGRPESEENLVMGFVACGERYRMRGITKSLVQVFEKNARDLGFKHITLGAHKDAEGFYTKCGYSIIDEVHGQNVFRKIL